jgi:acyl-CoA reductase-like NAD-dependent aldehyde dehydrogenase
MQSYGLYVNGEWIRTSAVMQVQNKYTQQPIADIAVAERTHVDRAVECADAAMRIPLPPYERYRILSRVSQLLIERKQQFANLLVQEVGKPIRDALGEVERAAQTLMISAEESKRIHGEGIPVEAAPGSENRIAFTIRVPVGVIAAITPFNVPLNLVCHKVGPAIAAGNAVVLKPSELTPLVSFKLAELFAEAGLPAGRLNIVTGVGREIGSWLVENPKVRMFSFTGSVPVGEWLRQRAGLRKVSLELGNNSANIVHRDCDLEHAAEMIAAKGFNNAGQVCISVQRVFVHEEVRERFVSLLIERTNRLKVGDPSLADTEVGPMISVNAAERVEDWVREAVEEGAVAETGGRREGALFYPTLLTNVKPSMKVCRNEVFGPVIAVESYRDVDDVIRRVNDSDYGLQAGLFTRDLAFAMKAAKEIEVGGLIVNDASAYRVDQMPYGGVKNSGTGKEGPAYAIEEMTEERLVVLNL